MIYNHATNNESDDPRVIRKARVLADRALRYSVNLDGFVFKDNVYCPSGGYAIVWSGILRLKDAMAAGKEIARNRFLGGGDTVKVHLLLTHDTTSDGRDSRWL